MRERFGGSNFAPVDMIANPIDSKSSYKASLAAVIPLVLVLMTITGAVYPAIDLTAGERERGTMEALIATPVPRFALLFSKYIAVLTVAILTASANLLAMFVTLNVGGLGKALLGDAGFPLISILQVFPSDHLQRLLQRASIGVMLRREEFQRGAILSIPSCCYHWGRSAESTS